MEGTKPAAPASPWLNAFFDPLAGLKTVASCVRLSDLNGDGDSKLCVCDFDQKLKVYKGTSLFAEYALLDVPVAMCAVFTELSSVNMSLLLFLSCIPMLFCSFPFLISHGSSFLSCLLMLFNFFCGLSLVCPVSQWLQALMYLSIDSYDRTASGVVHLLTYLRWRLTYGLI